MKGNAGSSPPERRVSIVAEQAGGRIEVQALLDGSRTASALWDILPVSGRARVWGDEVYFSIPLEVGAENQKAVVEKGDIGYWPPGKALCIFFGPTPASRGDEVRPASPVNVCGKIAGDPGILKKVRAGAMVHVDRAS